MRKLIIVTLMLMMITLSGCQLLNKLNVKATPVEIDGLGSLQSVKDKELNDEQLTKVIKTVSKRNIVNEEDAQVMLEIYERQAIIFSESSSLALQRNDVVTAPDIENYLALILSHKDLQAKVEQETTNAVIKSMVDRISFSETETVIGSAGKLQGVYYNAYSQTIAKNDENLRDEKFDIIQDTNALATVTAFEQAAQEIVNGKRENVTVEQKHQATEFLQDLKTYNDALPEGQKILDKSGKLLNIQKANDKQTDRMLDIIANNSGTITENKKEVTEALGRLSKKMRPTYSELRDATNTQIKRQ